MCCLVITKFLDPKEESLSDRDFDVFYAVFTINDLSQLKDQIMKDFVVHRDNFNLFKSGLVWFYLPQVLNFLELVEWSSQHYSETQNVIMSEDGIKVVCRIIAQSICETLGVYDIGPECQEFIEGSIPLLYKQMSLEIKVEMLKILIKPKQTLEALSSPYPSHIFFPKFQFVITIVCQVLGMENDQSIYELILGFIYSRLFYFSSKIQLC